MRKMTMCCCAKDAENEEQRRRRERDEGEKGIATSKGERGIDPLQKGLIERRCQRKREREKERRRKKRRKEGIVSFFDVKKN